MSRIFGLLLLVFGFVQLFESVPTASAAAVEALYVVNGTTLATYNVNPQTGQIKSVGTSLNLGSGVGSWPLASTRDGYFLYVPCCIGGVQALSVYATDAEAVPQAPAIQVIPGNFIKIVVDPNGRFAYGLSLEQDKDYKQIYSVNIFEISAVTGKLTPVKLEHRYNEGTCCAWFNLDGFSSGGAKLYDDQGSDLGGGGGSQWYEQQVDPRTGDLSEPAFLINGSYAGQGEYASVALGDKVILLGETVDGDLSQSWLDVYAHVPNPQSPLIHCTMLMLNVCGYVNGLQLDPSQQNVFISSDTYPITVAQINLGQGNLVVTGSTIPSGQTVYFNNSGTLVYALQFSSGSGTLSTYRFQASTGELTSGDQVSLGSSAFEPLVFPAQRTMARVLTHMAGRKAPGRGYQFVSSARAVGTGSLSVVPLADQLRTAPIGP